jgi:hypothetical protein
MKDKPTIEDLFQSKKLDVPSDEFWSDFQDRVKGQTMASLSQRNRVAKVRKAGLYSVVPVVALLLTSWNFLNQEFSRNSADSNLQVQAQSPVPSANNILASIQQDEFIEKPGAVQLARLESFDSFANAQIFVAGVKNNFNHTELHVSGNQAENQRFTF